MEDNMEAVMRSREKYDSERDRMGESNRERSMSDALRADLRVRKASEHSLLAADTALRKELSGTSYTTLYCTILFCSDVVQSYHALYCMMLR